MDIHSDGKHVFLYAYTPNAGAAYAFIGAFGLATIGHTVELFRLRAPHLIPFFIGCLSTPPFAFHAILHS